MPAMTRTVPGGDGNGQVNVGRACPRTAAGVSAGRDPVNPECHGLVTGAAGSRGSGCSLTPARHDGGNFGTSAVTARCDR